MTLDVHLFIYCLGQLINSMHTTRAQRQLRYSMFREVIKSCTFLASLVSRRAAMELGGGFSVIMDE